MSSRTLKAGTVQLWFLDRSVHAVPGWFDVLDPTEQARATAVRIEGPRAAYVAAHALVRTALSAALGSPPGTWRFEESRHGHPSVVGLPVRFSLSHAGPNAAVALCREHDLGLDLERVHVQRDPLPVAKRFFAASETALLTGLTAEQRPEIFTLLWTVKEAVLKARGTGLTARLDSVTVALDDALVPLSVEAPDGPWSVRAWAPEPGLRVALAVRAETMPALSVFRAAPLGEPVSAPELGPPLRP
jgi:4'-phosphopantetheinyl transferase